MPIEKIIRSGGKITYKASIFLGRDPKSGKKLRKFKSCSSMRAAKDWLDSQKEKIGKSSLSEDILNRRKKLLQVHIKDYLYHAHENSADNTYKTYATCINNWVLPFWGLLTAEKINKLTVEDFKKYLSEENCSLATQSYALGRLKTFFDYLVANDIIIKNPLMGEKIKMGQSGQVKIKYHENHELNFLLEKSKAFHYVDFIEFLYNTGLRIGEACAVRVSDYNSISRTLSISYQLQKFIPRPSEDIQADFELKATKGKERRIVVLRTEIAAKIEARIDSLDHDDFIYRPMRPRYKNVLHNRASKKPVVKAMSMINPREFSSDIFIEYQKRAGLENVLSIHATRHTFAVSFMRNGGDIVVLSKLLGHKSIEVTKVYLEFSPNYLNEFVRFVDFSSQSGVHQMSTTSEVFKVGKLRK